MEKTKIQEQLRPVYDYVIIGAGTCGGVLAGRLSEDSGISVLILEAGPDDLDNPNVAIPGKYLSLQETEYDWGYRSVSQKGAFKGFLEERCHTPRGKGLGGSGAINYMVYMRGTPHDYDIWENMGCTGWSYRDVLPYFIKSEGCLSQRLVDSGYHGRHGPILVSELKHSNVGPMVIKAAKELGYSETDCNGTDPLGFMMVQSNIGDGVRQSSAESYLRPASHRDNLHIATHCHVTKIHIDNDVARAVEFVRKGSKQLVRARREILLCAGAIGSPQILMLSGIGPREHLESLGIPVIKDLPVGNNYQDHCGVVGVRYEIPEKYSVKESKENDDRYYNLRAGYLAENTVVSTGLLRTSLQNPGNPNPDIQILCSETVVPQSGENTYQRNTRMKLEVWRDLFTGAENTDGFLMCAVVTHPKSRGTVRLASTDPYDPPLIDPNTFSHPDDIKVLVEGLKIIKRLCETHPMKAIGTKLSPRILPGYNGTPYTDEYWEEYARTVTKNIYHPCGSCRMGRREEEAAVVDPKLRVKGIERLRVVDASIMPEITSANLNAPCVMIAEKAADIIKGNNFHPRL